MDQQLNKKARLINSANIMGVCSILLLFLVATTSCANITKDAEESKIRDTTDVKLSPAYNHNKNPIANDPVNLNSSPTRSSNNNNINNRSKSKIKTVSSTSTIPIKFETPQNNSSGGSVSRRKKNKSNNNSTMVALPKGDKGNSRGASLPWPASLNITRALVNKSLKRLKGRLDKAAAAHNNNRRGSRGPGGTGGEIAPTSSSSTSTTNSSDKDNNNVRSFVNASTTTGTTGISGKSGQSKEPKQSWLAVASAVAHSTAAETNDQTNTPLNEESSSKPTKYHYYPHNQHLYLLPECATQQVCSAVYLRLNYSQPLCACPTFHEPCSVSTRTDDRHTIPLVTGSNSQVLTLVKTCEPTQEVRECRAPKDWSILALQNSRTGKAHYLVICRCPSPGYLEGPIAHSQPAYARVPGIRVYGMTCVRFPNRTGKSMRLSREQEARGPLPNFPWYKLKALFYTFDER